MAKADVLQLVSDLSGGLADPFTSEELYREAVLGIEAQQLLVSLRLFSHDTTADYDAPPPAVRILAVFYDDRELSRESADSLQSLQPDWRDRIGMPVCYVLDSEGDRRFRFFPRPQESSKDLSFPTGTPFGADFPGYAGAMLYTEARQDVPPWLELPLALLILAREFARESTEHRDLAFADGCGKLAARLLGWVA